jgi:hypothetical protein
MPREPYHQPILIAGQKTEVIVTRFTREQSFALRAQLNTLARRRNRTNEAIRRLPEGTELEQVFLRKDKEEQQAEEFQSETVRKYVTFGPGHAVDGRAVQTGSEIVAAHEDDISIMTSLFEAVVILNTLGEKEKNDWRSQRASDCGLSAASLVPIGPRPASAALSALSETSAA